MKRAVLCALLSTITWLGCSTAPAPERQAATEVRVPQALTAAQRPTCADAGGTCRKSACRLNEVLSSLQCGTDAACCLPR